MLIDTHAHIHHPGLAEHADQVVVRATQAGVSQIITVGVNTQDSQLAISAAQAYEQVWASIGIHPEDAAHADVAKLRPLASHPKVVAIGECGLDYSRAGRTRAIQEDVFRQQIQLAIDSDLPMIWHVRDAFSDFFEITGDYNNLRGVVHCFTSNVADMRQATERGYFVALNGIMTFSKLDWQLEAAKQIPLDRLILETDCPFLAPVPMRGRTNEPAYITETAQFLAKLRGQSYDLICKETTENARKLFGLTNSRGASHA